jgi:hypothetical protein
MKVLALSRKPRTYIPTEFRGQPDAPTFEIRSITKREHLAITAEMDMRLDVNSLKAMALAIEGKDPTSTDSGASVPIGKLNQQMYEVRLAVVKKCCSGWTGVPDADGEMLPYSEENVELLNDELLMELGNEIMGIIGGPDQKNLETPTGESSGTEQSQTKAEDGTAGLA